MAGFEVSANGRFCPSTEVLPWAVLEGLNDYLEAKAQKALPETGA